MHRIIRAAVGGGLLAVAAGFAPAAVILTTADGLGADSFVSNDGNQAATTTHGGEGSAAIRHYDTVRAKAMYVRFDLSGVTGDLSGATLSVYFGTANRARTMNVYGLTDQSLDSWSESGLAYNNAPGVLQPGDGIYNTGIATFDDTKLSVVNTFTTPSANGNAVTTAPNANFDAFLQSDTNGLVTLVLYTASSDSSQNFFVATKENTGASPLPTLTLPNATLVPEPASLALCGLAAISIRRRRK